MSTFTLKEFWAECRRTEEMALRKFNLEISAIIDSINMLVIIVDVVRDRHEHESDFQDIAITHIAKTIVSLEAALSAALRTFYSEAANLTRVGLETSWQMFYLFDRPDERKKWMNNKKIKTGDIRIGITPFDGPKELDPYFKVYEELCDVSHPRRKGMDIFFIHGDTVKIGPLFQEGYLLQALYQLHLFSGWIREDLIKRYFPGTFNTVIDPTNAPEFLVKHMQYKAKYIAVFEKVKEKLNGLMFYPEK